MNNIVNGDIILAQQMFERLNKILPVREEDGAIV